MGRRQTEKTAGSAEPKDELCWRELLFSAFSGAYAYEQIEKLLDHIEKPR